MAETEKDESVSDFVLAGRLTYLKIDLDTISRNISLLKDKCSRSTEVIAVVKANAYGHGSVAVSRHLERRGGVRHFAVATAGEGRELRTGGVQGYIQVLGNVSPVEIPTCVKYNLVPTISSIDVLSEWKMGERNEGSQFSENNSISIHSIMTHFAQSWDDPEFTKQQMDLFMETVAPFRSEGMKLHVSNSGAIITGVGTDLDFVRPGISIYGQPPDTSEFCVSATEKLGIRPAMQWIARPSMVKDLQTGRTVGYDKAYTCKGPETIATIPLGYADGYLRKMAGAGILTTDDGVQCPVVGRVSMDGITVKLPDAARHCPHLCVMVDDFHSVNSAVAMARIMNTIPYEVCTNLSPRIPRLYVEDGVVKPFD